MSETRRSERPSLCAVDDIPDGGSNGFFTETSDGRLLYMAVRRGDKVFVYENKCPHTGMPLDFQPGQFLTSVSQPASRVTEVGRFPKSNSGNALRLLRKLCRKSSVAR